MKSGLEGRNNTTNLDRATEALRVSMKSGLEDRNNETITILGKVESVVSMKSGLEDRNNDSRKDPGCSRQYRSQ